MLPILYSFRRCPYAMRARMALHTADIRLEHREILLKNKPAEMLAVSAKGTVPVLVTADNHVIDESLLVMLWALRQHDPENWLGEGEEQFKHASALIEINDGEFKSALDHYKYAVRFPQHPAEHYRDQGLPFLQQLQTRLMDNRFLLGKNISIADIAIFPFVRQFAFVDKDWFDQLPMPHLQDWLGQRLESTLFENIMVKHSLWQSSQDSDVQT